MIEIDVNGDVLDLPSGFTIEIEDSNPIFNERGSQSVPATVPATSLNSRVLKFPYRIDSAFDPNNPEQTVRIVNGAYIRSGMLNVTEARRGESITFNVGFDNSTAYAKWQQKKLAELSDLPVRTMPEDPSGPNFYEQDWVALELARIYQTADPQTEDLAVFPLAVGKEDLSDKNTLWEILNQPTADGLIQPTNVYRMIDGTKTLVKVPPHYGLSPFVRVWRIIEFIFSDLNISVPNNPFKEDLDLSRLVVLNNCADTCCTNTIIYKDLMPDVTVEEFLNALWVRFGLVYNVNFDKGTVDLRFIRDIIDRKCGMDLSPLLSGMENVKYNVPQYIKLSAKTSIEGAAPMYERFEEFSKGLDTSHILMGTDVSQWIPNNETGRPDIPSGGSSSEWVDSITDPDYTDPDFPDPDYPDPDYPDPDYDRDDGRPDDYQPPVDDDRDDQSRSSRASSAPSPLSTERSLAYEYVTGEWYRLDIENRKVLASSSSFFNWDPMTTNVDPLELTSDDECVPVIRVINDGTAGRFNDFCPTYLFGSRHYHSIIKGNDEADKSEGSTPLAFLFAYTRQKKTVGRFSPESEDGRTIQLDDGTIPAVSLLFQFKDGLFSKFWRQYDEILRHGNRNVEIPVRMSKLDVYGLDMFTPVLFRGVRCLVDKASYSLPSGRNIPVELDVRTLDVQGKYNISAEQGIPGFIIGSRKLSWRLVSETFGNGLNTDQKQIEAANKFKELTGYQPSGTEGDAWCIDRRSAILYAVVRKAPYWESDPALSNPSSVGIRQTRNYKASLIYDIYEIHDMTVQDDDGTDWELGETPLGRVAVEADYTVRLLSAWNVE